MKKSSILAVLAAVLAGCGAGDATHPQQGSMSSTRSQVMALASTMTLPGKRADYTVERMLGTVRLIHKHSAAVTPVPSDARIRFADFTSSMDIEGNAGKLYRLYKAAFDRTPDPRGLGYWMQAMDKGVSLATVAQEFVKSSEYRQVYGLNPTEAETINRYYNNVLGREGDTAGIVFWVGVLRDKKATVAEVLAGFSESPENQEGVHASIVQGIAYREDGVAYEAVADAGPNRAAVIGTAVTLDGSYSLGRTGVAPSYAWTVAERPAGSSAELRNADTAFPSIVPDKEGPYKLSLLVKDGDSSSTATTTVTAAQPGLNFMPIEARYSRGLDKVVTVSTNPNALGIVDPLSQAIRTVSLPTAVKNFSLSPNGKLAIVLYDSVASLVDLETARIVKSFATGGQHTDAFVTNAGIAYFIGQTGGQWVNPSITYVNARTGEKIPTQTPGYVAFYGTQYGVYAGSKNKVFLMSLGISPSDIDYFTIDPVTNHITQTGDSPYHGDYGMSAPLYLSENEDLIFTSNGNIFNTSDLRYAGGLSLNGDVLLSLSNSSSKDETVALTGTYSYSSGSAVALPKAYRVYTSALFFPAGTTDLPVIDGQQAYGLKIWHNAAGRRIALVQLGSATPKATGVRYLVVPL